MGLTDGFFRGRAEFFHGRRQRGRLEFETDRHRTHGRHHLRLSYKYHGPRGIRGALGGHGRQSADGADFPVGKNFLAIDLRRVHRRLSALVGGTHQCVPLLMSIRERQLSSFQRCLGGLIR